MANCSFWPRFPSSSPFSGETQCIAKCSLSLSVHFRGVRGARGQRQLPGAGPQVRARPRHRRRRQEGQPVGRRKAQLHHGKNERILLLSSNHSSLQPDSCTLSRMLGGYFDEGEELKEEHTFERVYYPRVTTRKTQVGPSRHVLVDGKCTLVHLYYLVFEHPGGLPKFS